MNDYAVVQYAGGGTTTTTYHRRKLSNILTKSNIETGLGYARGAANGVAPLNASSKIDATYLPSYVDDVLEYALQPVKMAKFTLMKLLIKHIVEVVLHM